MPLYEYACRACGADFERRLKFEERLESQSCPECGRRDAELRFSIPAKVGGAAAGEPLGVCPTTGNACGCAHALRN